VAAKQMAQLNVSYSKLTRTTVGLVWLSRALWLQITGYRSNENEILPSESVRRICVQGCRLASINQSINQSMPRVGEPLQTSQTILRNQYGEVQYMALRKSRT
jgi:hypothetical protein